MPLHFDWRAASQPADVVRPVLTALQQGRLVMLPAAAGYLIAADASIPDAVERLTSKVLEDWSVPTLVVSGMAEIETLTGPLPANVRKLLTRLWPGSLVGIVASDSRRFCAANHTAIDAVLVEAKIPLLARAATHRVEIAPATGALAESWGDELAIVVDAGPLLAKPITWLAVAGDGWRIEQQGSASEAEIIGAAAQWIVFVCTGNTCRSPMAEVLFKAQLANRLGCGIDALTARGYYVLSAGVSAYSGDGPSPEAVDVLRSMGVDLGSHRSQPLAIEVVAHADHLIAMTRSHLLAVLSRYPAIGGSMRLLCGIEGDLDDPIGGSVEVYAACAQNILHHIDRLIEGLVR